MKSVMQHQFSQIPKVEIPRSVFDRSHGYKTTFDEDYLIPFYIDEVLPGDTFRCKATLFARLMAQIVPIMDNLYMDTFYFFVPNRLLWDNWQQFCGEQPSPDDTFSFDTPVPTLECVTIVAETLNDYFGLPIGASIAPDCLFHRAYNLIWNSWFRDENLQDPVPDNTDSDGPDDPADYVLLKRGKRHDYFTSCLPWPQKGPGVELPLGTSAPVIGNGMSIGFWTGQGSGARYGGIFDEGSGAITFDKNLYGEAAGHAASAAPGDVTDVGLGLTTTGSASGMIADLSNATAATINSLRQAFQIQKLYERDARGGTRYIELLKSHFGVTSPDFRLQRPEFLGGSSTRINITPVPQTSSTTGSYAQGALASYGVAADGNSGFTKSFVEHGVIIGLVNVRGDITYEKGLNRMWSRQVREEFYWPALAHLGEQAVLNREIYCDGSSTDDDVFGFQERWAEYRYYPSQITGQLRSSFSTPLNVWHLAEVFASVPSLDETFIQSNTPVERIVAVKNKKHFVLDTFIELHCARPMPVYSVPGLIDHF